MAFIECNGEANRSSRNFFGIASKKEERSLGKGRKAKDVAENLAEVPSYLNTTNDVSLSCCPYLDVGIICNLSR